MKRIIAACMVVLFLVGGGFAYTMGNAAATDIPTSSFTIVSPSERILDSRPNKIAAGSATVINTGRSAVAAAVTITLTNTEKSGYLTAWNGSGPRPETSVANWSDPNKDIAAFAIVPLQNGRFTLYSSGRTDILVDLTGFYTSSPVTTTTTTTVPPTSTTLATTTVPSTSTTVAPTTTRVTTTTSAPSTTVPQAGSYPNIASNFNTSQWLVTGEPIPESSSWEPSGNFRTSCGFSHLSYDDAIVYPGQPGASPHLHMYFGNTGANANSTYESLRTTGSSTCQGGPLNRSAYWIPAVQDANNQVVVPSYINVYYKGNGSQAMIKAIQENPNGLRMLAGFDMGNPSNPNIIKAEWKCNGAGSSPTIPNCPSGSELSVTQRFPMCWDGRNLDSANHRSHMAYGTGGGGWVTAQGGCPAGYSIHLPEFTLIVGFTSDGNTQNWHASSDRMPGMTMPNGSTFHADWFGAWDNPVQTQWTKSCIVEMRNCVFGQLGNGTRLVDYKGTYNGPNRVTPPPR